MFKFSFLCLLAWQTLFVATEVFALDAKNLFQEAKDSVVLIMGFDKNNQPLSIGSGFFISSFKEKITQPRPKSSVPKIPKKEVKEIPTIKKERPTFESIQKKLEAIKAETYEKDKNPSETEPSQSISSNKTIIHGSVIVTNLHVIAGAASVRIKLTNGTVSEIKTILGVDIDHDLVLLETSADGKALMLSDGTPQIGEDIIAIGNPKGLEGTLSTGIVSGVRKDNGSSYYQVTAPISPGSSGGPIINENGEVLGISTFYVEGGQNLNFSMPSVYIRRMLKNPKRMKLAKAPSLKLNKEKKIIDKNVKIIEDVISYQNVEASLLNLNYYPVKNVRYIMIFYKDRGAFLAGKYPVHYVLGNLKDTVPPHLAKRFNKFNPMIRSGWEVTFRILDYEFVSQPGEGGLIPTFD